MVLKENGQLEATDEVTEQAERELLVWRHAQLHVILRLQTVYKWQAQPVHSESVERDTEDT